MKWQVRQIILRYRYQAITAKQRYQNVILPSRLVRRNFLRAFMTFWDTYSASRYTSSLFSYYKHPLSIVSDWLMSYEVHSPSINVVWNSDACDLCINILFKYNTARILWYLWRVWSPNSGHWTSFLFKRDLWPNFLATKWWVYMYMTWKLGFENLFCLMLSADYLKDDSFITQNSILIAQNSLSLKSRSTVYLTLQNCLPLT